LRPVVEDFESMKTNPALTMPRAQKRAFEARTSGIETRLIGMSRLSGPGGRAD
jgi:hypothetical protein